MGKLLSALVFGLLVLVAENAAAAKVCVGGAAVEVRNKCKTGETVLTAENVGAVFALEPVRTKEPFNISACRKLEESSQSDGGVAFSSVVCGGNEFLLNYGHYTEPVDLQYAVEQQMIYRDNKNIPFSVSVGVTHEGDDFRDNEFVLHVTATCCPV